MRLRFSGKVVGTIDDIEGEGLWMHGQFKPGSGMTRKLADFFRFMTSADNLSQDPPFPESFINEQNWDIVDDEGHEKGISVPAVQLDGLISWKWRDRSKTNSIRKRP